MNFFTDFFIIIENILRVAFVKPNKLLGKINVVLIPKGKTRYLGHARGVVLFRKVVCLVALFCMLPSPAFAAKKSKSKNKNYSVSARSAILLDVSSQKRLYGKNIHLKVKPASTTKVMTALLVLEKLQLDDIVTVGKNATFAQPSKINVQPGEQYRVEDLLYALLLNSANDVSIVLAEAVAGSEAKFVSMMNHRARKLGAKNTKFANSNGLPTKNVQQYSSAYDMSLIFREVLKYDFFKKAIMLPKKNIVSLGGKNISLKSHNKMLFTDWGRKIYGKTGYTRAAQACFIGTTRKGNRTLIVAVFGCSRRWEDIRFLVRKFSNPS